MKENYLELTKKDKDKFVEFIKDFEDNRIVYITSIESRVIIELWNKANSNLKYIIELLNVISTNNRGLDFNRLLKYSVLFESSQIADLSQQTGNEKFLDYAQLCIWDKDNNVLPKFDIVCEKIVIRCRHEILVDIINPNDKKI